MTATTPILFDTHFHLDEGDDIAPVFAEARATGVERFLVVGTNLAGSRWISDIVDEEAGIFGTAGVHPHEARHVTDLTLFRDLLARPGMVAVGEIGLDYHYEHSPRKDQQRLFAQFLELAGELGLPSVIHCREAFDDCLGIVRDVLRPGQRTEFHSFTGTPAQAEAVLELGAMISVNGMITFKRADNIRCMLAAVPMDRLLLETDAPYLAPVPYRGKTNTPAYLVEIARRVAQEKGLALAEVAEITTRNGCEFFGLS